MRARLKNDMGKLQDWTINPVLFILVVGLAALFVAALLYQIIGSR